MRQQNKKILYLLFFSAPSRIVRAETFNDLYRDNHYSVKYYKLYNEKLSDHIQKFKDINLSFFVPILEWINKKLSQLKKIYVLLIARRYDGIIFVKYVTSHYIKIVRKHTRAKLLYEFDDSMWLNNIFGNTEFERIICSVDYVSCDNDYLKQKAEKYNRNTFVVKGPPQVEKFIVYQVNNPVPKNDLVVIGWVGSQSSLFYLESIYDVLEKIGSRYSNVVLRILGSGSMSPKELHLKKIKYELIPEYNEPLMIKEISAFDIGLYPLFNDELSIGRGFLKATIYMSAGVPVVCSNIGLCQLLIKDNFNGFLANSSEEWFRKLSLLIDDKDMRKKIGTTAQQEMLKHFNKKVCFEDLKTRYLDML